MVTWLHMTALQDSYNKILTSIASVSTKDPTFKDYAFCQKILYMLAQYYTVIIIEQLEYYMCSNTLLVSILYWLVS